MTNLLTKASATAFALSLALTAPLRAEMDANSVVATVNGTEITLGHMIMVKASLPEQYRQLPDDVLWDGILDQLVQQTVLSQQEGAEETQRVRLALDNERRTLLASEAVEDIVEQEVTEEAIRAAYEARYASADQGTEYNASHILVETQEEAAEIVQELKGGAEFAEMAKSRSTGPSGPGGGNLGWFGAGMMVPEFQAAVEALEVGEISDPVETQFGWHVITLNETRAAQAPELEAVRGEIASELQQQVLAETIGRLLEDAEVTRTGKDGVDTSVLNDTSLLED